MMSDPIPADPPPKALPRRLVLGLGNPGPDYAGTRHNVGFAVLDLLVSRHGLAWEEGPESLLAVLPPQAEGLPAVVLAKPLTFMNRSGRALRKLARRLELEAGEQLFVITDDIHLPLGGMRLRASGSTGGHNGLASIEETVGSPDYPRLRFGVDAPTGGGAQLVDFVLAPFSSAEQELLEDSLDRASWAVEDWAGGLPFEELQARYNRRKPQAET